MRLGMLWEDTPISWATSTSGENSTVHPAFRIRVQRSTSSTYMKYPSSKPPSSS
jgi:hypothetical protein